MNFKQIYIGQLIETRVVEKGIEIARICNFMDCSEKEITEMYSAENLETGILLRWSKLLEYDFFRLYTQHLILYAPPSSDSHTDVKESAMPQFRKNIYTKEVISFILEMIETNEKTKSQIIEDYKIPKTTLYKWIKKYDL